MAGIPSYKENLEHHYKTFRDYLDDRPIIEIMVAKGKIRRTEKEHIDKGTNEKDKRSIFLDILLDKEDDSVDIFVAALYDTGQYHLASVIEGKGKEQLMTQEHLDILTRNRHTLVHDMDCSFVLEVLQSDLVFTVEDAHTVNACTTPFSKNSCLLDILARKADAAFTSLVHGLRRSGQNHLADLLQTRSPSLTKELKRRRQQGSLTKDAVIDGATSGMKELRMSRRRETSQKDVVTDGATSHIKEMRISRRRETSPSGEGQQY